jgi:hypothetical protein
MAKAAEIPSQAGCQDLARVCRRQEHDAQDHHHACAGEGGFPPAQG